MLSERREGVKVQGSKKRWSRVADHLSAATSPQLHSDLRLAANKSEDSDIIYLHSSIQSYQQYLFMKYELK